MKTRSVRNGCLYVFNPVWLDRTANHLLGVSDGAIVRVIQPFGCPKNGTLGQCYVEDVFGQFIGMVCTNSLTPARELISARQIKRINWRRDCRESQHELAKCAADELSKKIHFARQSQICGDCNFPRRDYVDSK